MKNQLNPNENSSILLGAIMGVTPGQAKIVSDLPPEAQQPAIDMCKEAARVEKEVGRSSTIFRKVIWLGAHESVTKKLVNT